MATTAFGEVLVRHRWALLGLVLGLAAGVFVGFRVMGRGPQVAGTTDHDA